MGSSSTRTVSPCKLSSSFCWPLLPSPSPRPSPRLRPTPPSSTPATTATPTPHTVTDTTAIPTPTATTTDTVIPTTTDTVISGRGMPRPTVSPSLTTPTPAAPSTSSRGTPRPTPRLMLNTTTADTTDTLGPTVITDTPMADITGANKLSKQYYIDLVSNTHCFQPKNCHRFNCCVQDRFQKFQTSKNYWPFVPPLFFSKLQKNIPFFSTKCEEICF